MRDQIIEILKEVRPEFDFSTSENFIEEGMLDSFDVVTLVCALDERFNISIDGLDVVPLHFSSVDSIVSLLKKYKVAL